MTNLGSPRVFSCPAATGEAYDHGAHVTAWTPAGQAPVLWMSAQSAFDDAAPIRGGVPVCWPWFGMGRSKDLAPPHGFARIHGWTFVGETVSDDAVVATWTLSSDQASDPRFAGSYRATYTASLGADLELSLAIENTGDADFSYEEALHTYLAVGDIRQVSISGLDGASYLDKAPGGGADPVLQSGDVVFTAETDRVYDSAGPVTLSDPVLGRTITVTTSGAANTVVWNPWIAKSVAMGDFGDEEWRGMVCIEGANALDNAVVLPPGGVHTLTYRLTVAALSDPGASRGA